MFKSVNKAIKRRLWFIALRYFRQELSETRARAADGGYRQGYKDCEALISIWYDQGYANGVASVGSYDMGYHLGYQDGTNDGSEAGYDVGYEDGYQAGLESLGI